jgi:hypothetical protein
LNTLKIWALITVLITSLSQWVKTSTIKMQTCGTKILISSSSEFLASSNKPLRSYNFFFNCNKCFHNFLKRYANERSANTSVNLFYSTPSCYLKSLHDAKITWPTKVDDFFPYASDPHAFWTGYFTSRPTVKRMERVGNHYLQVGLLYFQIFKRAYC